MRRLLLKRTGDIRGQASAELAIMGAVILMLLGYLFSQGLMYNNRQALEMYSYRKALQLSQKNEKGITLTVIRDALVPSFFAGISRQRLMSSSSVDYNVWKLYNPKEDEPQDIGTRQLVQIGDAMIYKNYFLEIPATLVKVVTDHQDADDVDAEWIPSSISDLDSQLAPIEKPLEQNSTTLVKQTYAGKDYSKVLQSNETIPMVVTFEDKARMNYTYYRDDWGGNITSQVEIHENTIPANATLMINETVRRVKDVWTPN